MLLLLALLPPASGQVPVAAMLTDLQGRATITQGGRSVPATILAEVMVGAQLQLQADSAMVLLVLDSGVEYLVKGPAQIVMRQRLPEALSGVPPVPRATALGPSIRVKPVGLGQGAVVMRSLAANNRIRLLSANGTVLLDRQPELRWQEPQGGLRYVVELADDTGRILHEHQVDGTAMTVPADPPLKDGQTYTWAVSTRLPDGRKYASTGEFSIAGTELRAQAIALAAAAGTDLSWRVTYGAWLEQAGLKDAARKLWRVLAAERPEDGGLKALAAR